MHGKGVDLDITSFMPSLLFTERLTHSISPKSISYAAEFEGFPVDQLTGAEFYFPDIRLPVPHAFVVQNSRSQTIVLQTSNPTVVRHAQLAKHTATLPHDDRRVEVFGRWCDENLFRVLRQCLADLRLEVGAEMRSLGGAADDHDAAE